MAPTLVVVAGPNGSGKSTLIAQLMKQGFAFGYHINADDIARELRLQGEEGAREAQALADSLREAYLEGGGDFSFETVMSHPSKIKFMARAVERGYMVALIFVATSNPLLNISRVEHRTAQGGHDVPADRIVSRYRRTLDLLPDAVATAHRSIIFDNSDEGDVAGNVIRPVAECLRNANHLTIVLLEPPPPWLIDALLNPSCLDRLERNGLTVVMNW